MGRRKVGNEAMRSIKQLTKREQGYEAVKTLLVKRYNFHSQMDIKIEGKKQNKPSEVRRVGIQLIQEEYKIGEIF